MMIPCHDTQRREDFVLRTKGQQCRDVFFHSPSVAELIQHGQAFSRLTVGRTVVQTDFRLKLILGTEVELAYFIVQADNGRKAPPRLVAVKCHVFRSHSQSTHLFGSRTGLLGQFGILLRQILISGSGSLFGSSRQLSGLL